MEPFFFGENRELFGAYHMASGMPRRHGILIAGPLLNEGIRAQLALKRIAERLSAGGYDVLRFDYKGLGNSPVQSSRASVADWAANIITAADELPDIAGVKTGTLIAVRFAACLAADLTSVRRIERLLLWDPVLSGARWLADLHAWQESLPLKLREAAKANEYMGHETRDGFGEELAERSCASLQAGEIAAVLSEDYLQGTEVEELTDNVDRTRANCPWARRQLGMLYPTQIIEAICKRLS